MSEATARKIAMLREAKDRYLFVSPPYGDSRSEAFLAGYEAALSDIARGELTPRTRANEEARP